MWNDVVKLCNLKDLERHVHLGKLDTTPIQQTARLICACVNSILDVLHVFEINTENRIAPEYMHIHTDGKIRKNTGIYLADA